MSRRSIAIALFGALALAEIGDLIGLVLALASPADAAAQLSISPRAATLRAIILVAPALLIVLNGLLAVVGAANRSAILFQFGALMAGAGLLIGGVYQLATALFQHGRLQYAALGLLYIGLAALAWWFSRSAPAVAAKPQS